MTNEAERALRHAVRTGVVLRYLGELSLVLGITALLPMLGALLLGEPQLLVPYGLAAALLLAIGGAARRLPAPRELQRNEALVVTAAVFALSPVVLSASLVWAGTPWLDALFEAVSGVTTTGLSTLASVEGRPRTFLLARAWMQWVGGLGFVVLSLALALEQGVAARRLGAPSLEPADFAASTRRFARQILTIYLALTGVALVTLLVLGASPFDACVHAFASVSTGGFAPRDQSLAALGRPLQTGVLAISLLGAVSLPLYAGLRSGGWRRLVADRELRLLLVLVAVGALLLVALEPAAPIADRILLSVSAQSTTGFSTFAVADLPDASKAVVIGSMLTGGSLGSTSGGVKLLRVILALRLIQWLITRTRLPSHAVSWPTLRGERLGEADLLRAVAIILLFAGVVLLSWLAFLAHGYPPLDALFEVASATGTVGLSVGIARPDLEPLLKGILCLDMLLGRLEVFAVLVALSPRTWIGRRAS